MLAMFSLCFALMLTFVVGVKCGQGWRLTPRPEPDPEAEAFIARMHAGVRETVERKAA
jgi:hypothetical protein